MADQRTMAQLLQAPTEGYEDAIVVSAITADNFELKHGLLTLVQNKQFSGHDKEDPHAHVRYLNKITSTLKFPNVPNTSIKLMLFPFLLEDKMPRECLGIIESKSKVRYSRNKPVVAKVSTTASTFAISPDVAELKDMVRALLLDKKGLSPTPVKIVEESCVTCGAITTRSGVSYDGPQIMPPPSSLPPVVENEPEATKDTVNPTNNRNTKDVQPQAVHLKPITSPISEPAITLTGKALIDVFEGELTLRVGKEAITFNLDQTSRYSANYSDMTAKRIDIINVACEEYSQEVLGFSDTISSGNPTPDFLLEEDDAFLAVKDEPPSS
nr:reverse transcriptase domain-containing protein [Tanacetum cinerariifolium]